VLSSESGRRKLRFQTFRCHIYCQGLFRVIRTSLGICQEPFWDPVLDSLPRKTRSCVCVPGTKNLKPELQRLQRQKEPKFYLPPIWPLGIGLIQETARLIAMVITPMIQNTFP